MTGSFELAAGPWPRRPMSRREAQVLRGRARTPMDQALALVLLPLLLGAVGWLIGSAAGWVVSRVGMRGEGASVLGLASLGALGLGLDVLLWKLLRRTRAPAREDLRGGEVELLEATPRRVVDIGTQAHPALIFDRGDGTLLYLSGPALTRAQDGSPAPVVTRTSDFPTSRFTVVRAPRSGVVVSVEVEGEPVRPETRVRPPGVRLAMLEWRESEVLLGTL